MSTRLLCAGLALMLAGCATLVSGTTQPIRVDVLNAPGASCTGADTLGQRYEWPNTPSSAVVRKGADLIWITCEKPGFKTASHAVYAQVTEAARLNIFAVPLRPLTSYYLTYGVDRSTGADRKYVDAVKLVMEPEEGAPASLKTAYLSMKKKLDEELQKEAEEGIYLKPQLQPQERDRN